jgi:hypothetical protein
MACVIELASSNRTTAKVVPGLRRRLRVAPGVSGVDVIILGRG